MNRNTITTGLGGSVNVFEKGGNLVPGKLRFDILNGRDIAIWQVNDGVLNKFLPNLEYSIQVSNEVRDLQGVQLFSSWDSKFTTTGEGFNDFTPPTITLALDQPQSPNNIFPGQLIKISAFASDQGTAVQKVELRSDDLTIPEVDFKLLDQKNVLNGDKPPFIFIIDSKNLVPGHTYQLRGTAYDFAGNSQDATLSFSIALTAPIPTITIPAIPNVLKGVPLTITPDAVTGGAFEVSYFIDGDLIKTVQLSPYSVTIPTLNLTLGTHSLSAVAKDGLNQVGQTLLNFEVLTNTNAPQITFIDPIENQNVLTGSVLPIKVTIEDPVGLQSIQWFFDNPNGSPFASNVTQFTINTVGIPLGTYKVYLKATNNLGISNNVNATGSFRTINIIDPPPAPPPVAPSLNLSNLSSTSSGTGVTASGLTVSGRRVDIKNITQGFSITVNSHPITGEYSGFIEGAALDQISVVAFDPSGLTPSAQTVQIIALPPQLQSISLNQNIVTFPNLNETFNLITTGLFDNGSSQNITANVLYSTSNPVVASVNSLGKIVANGNGTATITASLDGKSASITVNVTAVSLQSISVAPLNINFSALSQTSLLTVTGNFSNSTTQTLTTNLLFTTGDPGIATVNSLGLVTATGVGNTTITVSREGVSPISIPVSIQLNDNLAPSVGMQSPLSGDNFERGQNITININAVDLGSGVRKVSYATTGSFIAAEERIITPISSTSQSFTLTIPNNATINSSLSIIATAIDLAGNIKNSTAVSVNIVDITAPQVNITAPTPNSRYNFDDEISLDLQGTDGVGVSALRYETSGAFVLNGSQNFSGTNSSETHTFRFRVPFGVTNPDLRVKAFARDLSGNESLVDMVDLIVTSADITAPVSIATGSSSAGSSAISNITFQVTDGLSDLSHVELYFRRNGIGTFNRYTDSTSGNPTGKFLVTSGSTGSIPFDSTKMGGDGSYEFYTAAVDLSGNREEAPVNGVLVVPDQTQSFSTGAPVELITTNRTVLTSDLSLENKNIKVTSGAILTVIGSHTFKNVELLSGAVLSHNETDATTEGSLDLTLWSLSIDSSSSINLDGRGYLGGSRPGNSNCQGMTVGFSLGATQDSAASYGGLGAQFGGGIPNPTYGLINFPDNLGSGGSCRGPAGGDGGGRARISAINVAADGLISANGAAGEGNFAGSGSGGALRFTVSTFSGTGEVRANGGTGNVGAGGGRVAIFYTDMSTKNKTLFKALGGNTGYNGGVGTVFLKAFAESNGALVVDGQPGVTTYTEIPVPPGFVFDSITLRAGARVITSLPLEVTNELNIIGNSILTHTTALEAGLSIKAKRVFIEPGSSIDVAGRGYLGGSQPGNGSTRGLTLGNVLGATQDNSASYGGLGGYFGGTSNPVYGSPFDPIYLGSGGPARGPRGGNGGGRITIETSESLEVDGLISANGGLGEGNFAGSGSGGSVYIKTKILKGTGQISANGGTGNVGAGGGRIRIDYQFLDQIDNFNTLQDVTSYGGNTGGYNGSPGTIVFKKTTDVTGELVVDSNISPAPYITPLTPLGFGKIQSVTSDSITIDGAVPVAKDTLVGLIINPNLDQNETYKIISNTETVVTVDIAGKPPVNSIASINNRYSLIYAFDKVTVRDGAILELADKLKVTNLLKVTNQSSIKHRPSTLDYYGELDITASNLEIDSGSSLDALGRGYLGGLSAQNSILQGRTKGNAIGATQDNSASHAGIGGFFGGISNPVYGSITEPVDLGAGGPSRGSAGGNGGGFIRLNISNNLNVDGFIRANGAIGTGNFAGSGAGGSINIRAGTLSGNGKITANGGDGNVGAGGGRISARFNSNTFPETNFEVKGGFGSGYNGGAGTLYLKSSSQAKGDLVIDAFNFANNIDSTVLDTSSDFDRVVLRNGVKVVVKSPINLSGDLSLENNSILSHPGNSESGLSINVRSFSIDSTSKIDLTDRGYRGGLRDGNTDPRGRTLGDQLGATQDSAASYGGVGGGFGGSPGFVYGSPFEPLYLGAGGPSRSSPGGNGGGLLSLTVNQILKVDGGIIVNGGAGLGNFAGSGAGGSILINTSTLRGSGIISANGGGNNVGGGGGRVRINYSILGGVGDNFNNLRNITAFGGSASYSASPGTVLLKTPSQSYGTIIFDGGSISGTPPETTLTEIGYGNSTQITADTLTAQSGVTYLPGSLVGLKLNPNLDQTTDFVIISNTENTITVDISSGINLLSVSSVGDEYAASYKFDDLILRGAVKLTLNDPVTVLSDIVISENSILSHKDVTMTRFPRLELSGSSLTIEALSSIDVSARGYLGGSSGTNPSCRGRTIGNALGADSTGGGAAGSYGGLGGLFSGGIPNAVYGSALNPVDFGSGGACRGSSGGDGGGIVFLNFGSVIVNGTISSNGGANAGNFAGDGSGGSIRINTSNISGSGLIRANGGNNNVGGGGGRISITAPINTINNSQLQVLGGVTSYSGQNGSISVQ